MIVHSTRNNLDDTCVVRVEGIDPNMSELGVKRFAGGAAAKHNEGFWCVARSVAWCDDQGRPLPATADTSAATIALVTVVVKQP